MKSLVGRLNTGFGRKKTTFDTKKKVLSTKDNEKSTNPVKLAPISTESKKNDLDLTLAP